MFASLSEARCLAGFVAASGTGFGGLVATRGEGDGPVRGYVFREVAAAGCVTAWVSCAYNWTDVAKVRMQAPRAGAAQYGSLSATVRRVVLEEGLLGLLLPGIVASALRDITYSGLSIGMYPAMKRSMFGAGDEDVGLARKFATGMACGALFSGFVSPTDLVKIRVQAEAGRVGEGGVLATGLRAGQAPRWSNSLEAFLVLARAEGFVGLFRGCGATMARAACGRGAQLSCYDHSKYLLKRHAGMREGLPLHALGSFLSGLAFATAAAPADIVKTRLMSSSGGVEHRGAADCCAAILREGGPRAFFRGWTPSAARLAPHFTCVGVCMEQARQLVGVGYFAA